jgi:hypothetical protein
MQQPMLWSLLLLAEMRAATACEGTTAWCCRMELTAPVAASVNDAVMLMWLGFQHLPTTTAMATAAAVKCHAAICMAEAAQVVAAALSKQEHLLTAPALLLLSWLPLWPRLLLSRLQNPGTCRKLRSTSCVP